MKKISVVIPMYNSAAFISQCIDSVCNQTYPYWEIIVVDDGSTDQSKEICEKLCLKDKRIQLLCQEKKGVSAARNHGIELATGKYVFFLDSDDAIHPLLFEEFIVQAERHQVELIACKIQKLNNRQMKEKLNRISERDKRPLWRVSGKDEAEEWFHIKYLDNLPWIGGKMILRDSIGTLRFDENLVNGEDTWFLYQFIQQNPQIAYCEEGWYYYRVHPDSATQAGRIKVGEQYWEVSKSIRDREYRKHHTDFAISWENVLTWQMEQKYVVLRKKKEKEKCKLLKKIAMNEKNSPLFHELSIDERLLFYSSFFFIPFYIWLKNSLQILWKISSIFKARDLSIKEEYNSIGIITFHCSDNYGAMLQAYGLKKYLLDEGVGGSIIRYEPFFMTGRHWWIPYIPSGKLDNRIRLSKKKWKIHLQRGINFFRLRANMRHFRKEYLIEKKQRILFFSPQLRKLPFRYYIVGSDQIWNPAITLGLRNVYFGAFPNRRKEKVIAYGASLGGKELPTEYDKKFSELIKYVDVVSLREEDAVSYVQKFYRGEVETVLDPVFLLERKHWQKIEKQPKQKNFIFVYQTEYDHELVEYTKRLSKNTGLPVLELQAGTWKQRRDFSEDQTAGPAEFLGYIHQATYVVSNSFHAIAFSIIFEKKFLAFLFDSRGARIKNILRIAGLENRLYEKEKKGQIDFYVDWSEVRREIKGAIEHSEAFLKKNLDMQEM